MPPGPHAQQSRAAHEAQEACRAPLGDRSRPQLPLLCTALRQGGLSEKGRGGVPHSPHAGLSDRWTGPCRPLARGCRRPRGCVCLKPPAAGTWSPSGACVPLLGRKLHILHEREDAGPGITCRWPCVHGRQAPGRRRLGALTQGICVINRSLRKQPVTLHKNDLKRHQQLRPTRLWGGSVPG